MMKWKHVMFYILLLAGCIALGKLVKLLAMGLGDIHEVPFNHYVSISISVLIIAGCGILAKQSGLWHIGGFRGGKSANYWMLFLPLIFPGLLMFKIKNYNCIEPSLIYFSFMLYKLLAATVEETLFRGVILGHLQKHYAGRSAHFYCIISATFFSLIHLTNLQSAPLLSVLPQLVYAFIMGLFLAALMLRIQNVWLLGITHGILNTMTVNVCKEILQTRSGQDTGTSGNTLMAVLGILLYLLPVLVMYMLLLNTYRYEPDPESLGKNKPQRDQD